MKQFSLDNLPDNFPREDARVIYKYAGTPDYGKAQGDVNIGVVVDCETNADDDATELIELCILPFEFDNEGRLGKVYEPFTGMREPNEANWDLVTKITGIRKEDCEGQEIDWQKALKYFDKAELVIAHNAEFDRRVLEGANREVPNLLWGCSMRDIDWDRLVISSHKLEYLSYKVGSFYYDAHRAEMDCRATLHVLAHSLGEQTGFQELLKNALTPQAKVMAFGSPFETKNLLRTSGYRWDPDNRTWWKQIVLEGSNLEDEKQWLEQNVYWNGKFDSLEIRPVDVDKRYQS